MRVYRVEHRQTQAGPYQYLNAATRHDRHGGNSHGMPTVWDDREVATPIRRAWKDYRQGHFGFKDLQQLHAWFRSRSGRNAMARMGFHIAVIEIDPDYVDLGNYQLTFQNKHARRVGSISLASWAEPRKGEMS